MFFKLLPLGTFLLGWAFGEMLRLLWGRGGVVAFLLLAPAVTSGCALLAPVDEHAASGDDGRIYYRGGDVVAAPGVGGDGGSPAVAIVDGGSVDAGLDARLNCEHVIEDGGAGPVCPAANPTRYACNRDSFIGADCEKLGVSGGRWWICC